jgi:peptide chain release factor 1
MATEVIKALTISWNRRMSTVVERFRSNWKTRQSVSDPAKLIPLSREQGKLMFVVGKYRKYKTCLSQLEEARQMMREAGGDAEMKAMAEEEAATLEKAADSLIEEIKDTLVMADDAAIDSVIVEIRPGTGGEEAALFARDLIICTRGMRK